jgi:hypothetical protein
MGPSRFTYHPRGRCAADFYRPQKSIALDASEPATFGSSIKHANLYTAMATNPVQALILCEQKPLTD